MLIPITVFLHFQVSLWTNNGIFFQSTLGFIVLKPWQGLFQVRCSDWWIAVHVYPIPGWIILHQTSPQRQVQIQAGVIGEAFFQLHLLCNVVQVGLEAATVVLLNKLGVRVLLRGSRPAQSLLGTLGRTWTSHMPQLIHSAGKDSNSREL